MTFRKEGLEGHRERSLGGYWDPQEPCSQPASGCAIHIPFSDWDQTPIAKKKPGRDSSEIGLKGNRNRILSFPLGLYRSLG